MVFEPNKYVFVIFSNNNDIPYEPVTIQKLYLNLLQFEVIPGSTTEFTLPEGTKKAWLKFYSIDNSFAINFRQDRIDIECQNVPGKQCLSYVDFCEKAKNILIAIEKTHPRKANRLAFVTTLRNTQLTESEMDSVYKSAFGKLTDISDVPPMEWNHRTCRRYPRLINNKKEIFNNIYNISRANGLTQNNVKLNYFELAIDINTNPENIGVRFSIEDYKDFLANIGPWNEELTNNVFKILN